jgi:hypothetical protein
MDNTLNQIRDLERELKINKEKFSRVENSSNYTTIQKKEYEIGFVKKEKELNKEKKSFSGKIIETTLEVRDVEDKGKNLWTINLQKKFSDEWFDLIFIDVDYESRSDKFDEIIFKLVKGDLVILKMEITYYGHGIHGELISIQRTSNKKCFIGTVCFDSFDSKEVILFRKFRDEVLITNFIGRTCVSLYYKFSPKISVFIGKNIFLKSFFKNCILYPIYFLIRFFRFV